MSSVRAGFGRTARREPPRVEAWQRARGALQREQRRPHEDLEADEARDRVPGEAEDERPVADAEPERLPGLHRHAPEHLLDPEPGADRADEIVRADRDAARRDEHVAAQARFQRGAMRGLVVLDRVEQLDLRAGRSQLRREQRAVRLVDLPGLERARPAGGAPFRLRSTAARGRREHDTSGTPAAASAPICAAPSSCAGLHDHVAEADVPASRPDVRSSWNRIRDLDRRCP